MHNLIKQVFRFYVVFLASIIFTNQAIAQDLAEGASLDNHGVNLVTAGLTTSKNVVSIGAGEGALGHSTSLNGLNRADTSQGYVQIKDSVSSGVYPYIVKVPSLGVFRFTANTNSPSSSTSFTPFKSLGTELSYSGAIYTFTSTHGTVAVFDSALVSDAPDAAAHVTTVTKSNGLVTTYTYNRLYASGDWKTYVKSVHNSLGYQLKYQNPGVGNTTIIGINNYHEYCNPAAQSCSVASHWPRAVVSDPNEYIEGFGITSGTQTYTDAENRTYTLGYDAYPNGYVVQGYTNPVGGGLSAVYLNGDVYAVYSGQNGNNATGNNYAVSIDNKGTSTVTADDEKTVTVTFADSSTKTVKSRIQGGLILSSTDELGQAIVYVYNNNNTLQSVTFPRGNSVHYIYDARGNTTSVRRKSVPGAGALPDIVMTAGYPSSCTVSSRKYCNKPTWTRDALGKQTDYTYASQHGGVLTVTKPAPASGQTRPQTTYTYSQYRAKVKNSSGALVDEAPIWNVSNVRSCATATSCSGSAAESVVEYTYNVNENLLRSYVKTKAGDNSVYSRVWYDYDSYGNLISENGPESGNYDLAYYRYNKMRQKYGTIGVDPDGSGPMKRVAGRTTLNSLGLATKIESGTVNGYTSSDWAAFVSHQSTDTEYDYMGRVTKASSQSAGTTNALQQYSYDSKKRLSCTATRMNPAQFSSSPADACVAGSAGSYGPDRIVKREYDVADRVTKTISGYGTSTPITEEATYYNYGPVQYLYDGKGNRTYYQYDNFNRSSRTYFPNATGSGHNPSDYIQNFYDNYGRLNRVRQRDGENIYFTIDDLGRQTFMNAPGSAEDTALTYDLLGRLTSVSKSGQTITKSYDALSRLLSESSNLGAVIYQYNEQGRRTRMDYPGSGGFFVTYDYLTNGQITHIREKGAVSGQGVLASYNYDTLGRRTGINRGNGVNTNFVYDTVSRLTSMSNDQSGTTHDQTLSFTYSPSGQITSQTNSNTIYDPTASTFDATYAINGLNQITSENGSAFTYDAAGNLKTASGKTFNYDYSNRLTSVTGTLSGSLTYDPVGRLRSVASGSATTSFLYDGQSMIAEYNGSSVLRRYVHAPGADRPIVEYTGTGTSNKKWLIGDVRGSVNSQTATTGVATVTNIYDEYGRPDFSNQGRFQYTGQVWLAEIGLYYYKARFYDPDIGRFLQTDPIGYGAGMNMYAYVNNDPINLTDPSGLESAIICEFDGGCLPEMDEISTTARKVKKSSSRARGHVRFNLYHIPQYIYTFNVISSGNASGAADKSKEALCELFKPTAQGFSSPIDGDGLIIDSFNAIDAYLWSYYPWRSFEIGGGAARGIAASGGVSLYTNQDGDYGLGLTVGLGVGGGGEGHGSITHLTHRPGGFGWDAGGTLNGYRAALLGNLEYAGPSHYGPGAIPTFAIAEGGGIELGPKTAGGKSGAATINYTSTLNCGNAYEE